MLGKLLSGGEFGQWASFVTPAFFEVMPTKALWQRFKELVRATRDRELYARVVRERQALLARSSLSVKLAGPDADAGAASSDAGPTSNPATSDPATSDPATSNPATSNPATSGPAISAEARAARVVALYFHQILHGDTTLLDLRQTSFSGQHPFVWRPSPWLARWEPGFSAALRQIYAGFYRDDDAEFRAGLRALNLEHCEDVFRQHFGGGQGSVRFEVKHFVSTFHQVFLRCRDAHTRLHPDFLLLGLYLATLYDHLERLDVSVDVAAAFAHAALLAPLPQAANAHA
jgi:hypothetical protein